MKEQVNASQLVESFLHGIVDPGHKQFFDNQRSKLVEIVGRYQAHPDYIEIPEDLPADVLAARKELRNNPLLILQSLELSADQLIAYQVEYDQMVGDLARVNGVEVNDGIADVRAIEAASIDREKSTITSHLANGGKVAAVVLGIGGTGKGTMIKKSEFPRVVNHTTRPLRAVEVEGVDYHSASNIDMEESTESVEEKLGPVVADLLRTGRGRYITTVEAVETAFEGSDVAFIEQSPELTNQIIERARTAMPDTLVMPICILPPDRGVIELATRVVARSYGDPNSGVMTADGFKIDDNYLETTIGPSQIAEIGDTTQFMEGEKPSGIIYIVNDDLGRAVETLDGIFKN